PVIVHVINREEYLFGDATAGTFTTVRLQRLSPAPPMSFFSASPTDFQATLPAAFFPLRIELVFVMSGFSASRCSSSIPRYVAGFISSHTLIISSVDTERKFSVSNCREGISEGFGASLGA